MSCNEPFTRWLARPLPTWNNRSPRALPAVRLKTAARASASSPWLVRLMVARPVLAVVVFVVAAVHGWWFVAVPATWVVYGGSLTCVHHLIHGSLGLTPRARHFWLRWIGMMVVESGHALQVTHLAHHRGGADLPDPEGSIENARWGQMPVAATAFRYRLMMTGLKMAPPPRRRRIVVELLAHALLHVASLALLPWTIVPWVYLTLIHLASFAFAVLAGKGPQTNYGRDITTPFVRVHTALGHILFFSHDLHLEHHAAPKVPLPHLRRLHAEFDAAFAGLDVLDVRMPL